MESCTQIYLNNNQIKHINSGAFNILSPRMKLSTNHLQVYLSHNNLETDSFEKEFVQLNSESNSTVYFDLSWNKLEILHEAIWKDLLESKRIFLNLADNPLNKTCEQMRWLMESPKLLFNTKGLA